MTPRLFLLAASAASVAAADLPEPKFQAVTLDGKVQIGYGVAVADVDGDKVPDVLLADKKQFVWYRNPGGSKAGDAAAWSKHVLAENLVGNSAALYRNPYKPFLRFLYSLANGVGYFVGFAEARADDPGGVAHDGKRGEVEPFSALCDLGDTPYMDDLFL